MAGLLWYRSYMDSLANKSGYYPDIHAGHADRVAELTLEAPYLVRETPAGYNQLELMKLVGGTVAWNQLCNSSSVTGTSGHKFYLKKSGVESITNTNTFTGLASGTDMVTDLTQMFGPTIADYVYSLEHATAGSGIAWLKSYGYFTEDYYAYSAPTLQSVEATAHVTVGKNLLDKSEMKFTAANAYIGAATVNGGADGSLVLPAGSYVFSVSGVNAVTGLYVTNSSNTNIAVRYNNTFLAFTLTETTAVKLTIFKTDVNAEILEGYNYQLELGSTATAYEPYTETTYPLDSDLVLRGIPKLSNGNLYYDGDTYEWDGTVTRYFGIRAYQAGDESLTDAITDGTDTVYKLQTPTTESSDPYTAVQDVEEGGTEEFVTGNNVPVGNVSVYRRA